MAAAATAAPGDEASGPAPTKGGKKKLLVLLAIPLVLGGVGAGLWFSGILPPLLGMGAKPAAEHGAGEHGTEKAADGAGHGAAGDHGAAAPAAGHGHGAEGKAAGKADGKADGKPVAVFMEMPEIIANLNAGPRRNSFIKLRPRLELAKAEDEAAVRAAMPRLLDLFQTYLREMRPDELRGSAGTYRLREELLSRGNIAVAPARILDVLFPEIIVQ